MLNELQTPEVTWSVESMVRAFREILSALEALLL